MIQRIAGQGNRWTIVLCVLFGIAAAADADCKRGCKQLEAEDNTQADCRAYQPPTCFDNENMHYIPDGTSEGRFCLPVTPSEKSKIFLCDSGCTDLCTEVTFNEFDAPDNYDDGMVCGVSTSETTTYECEGT